MAVNCGLCLIVLVLMFFCCSWRKALRCIFNLPPNTHSNILPIISDILPAFDEICKRTSRFISSCLNSSSCLVHFISWHGVNFYKYGSPLGSNALIVCKHFSWHFESFNSRCIDLTNNRVFKYWFHSQLNFDIISTALFLLELLFVRDGCLELTGFSKQQLTEIINYVATI